MLHKKEHTPRDVDYHFSHEIEFNTTGKQQTVTRIINNKKKTFQNPQTVIYDAEPPPTGIPTDNNRLTVAMDIGFWGGYLSHHHFVAAARLKTDHYRAPGDNRSGAAAIGFWTAQHGFPGVTSGAAIEEPEISDPVNNEVQNRFHNPVSHCVAENKRYRLILDSVFHDNRISHKIRLKDHSTGLIVYSNFGVSFSSFTRNYNTQSRLIMLATLVDPNATVHGGGSYSNLVSYWTLANEWIPDP